MANQKLVWVSPVTLNFLCFQLLASYRKTLCKLKHQIFNGNFIPMIARNTVNSFRYTLGNLPDYGSPKIALNGLLKLLIILRIEKSVAY